MARMDNDVAFWASRFQQHMDFITKHLQLHPRAEPAVLRAGVTPQLLAAVQRAWQSLDRRGARASMVADALVKDTKKIKQVAKKAFASVSARCSRDLMQHMLDELDYFTKHVLRHGSRRQEAQFWAKERRELLEYLLCNAAGALPQAVSAKLKDLRRRFDAGASLSRADVIDLLAELDALTSNEHVKRVLVATIAQQVARESASPPDEWEQLVKDVEAEAEHDAEEGRYALLRLTRQRRRHG